MKTIQFECPQCHAINAGDESLHGQRVACSKCQATMLVPPAPAGPPPPTARLLRRPDTGHLHEPGFANAESEVFELSPVARAYAGRLLLGGVLVVAGIGLAVQAPGLSWPRWAGLIPLIPGLVLLVSVWGQVQAHGYRLTTQRLFVRHGLWARRVHELELYRVKDVVVDQGVLQRLLGYGTITVVADDESTPSIHLVGVAGPTAVKEVIRNHYRAARQREGVRPTEFLQTP